MGDHSGNRAVEALSDQTLPRRSSFKPLDIPFESLLVCSLHHAKLGTVEYAALSYAWGDPAVAETILVDDEPFQVTTNLAAFLTTLNRGRAKWGWSLNSPLHFWVDAICINQANIPERIEQVLRMGEIYKTATRVLIWLGPHSIHTERAFDWLLEIEEEVNKLTKARNSAYYGQLTELGQRLVNDNIPKDLDIGVEMSV
jgi:hypothetical protein